MSDDVKVSVFPFVETPRHLVQIARWGQHVRIAQKLHDENALTIKLSELNEVIDALVAFRRSVNELRGSNE